MPALRGYRGSVAPSGMPADRAVAALPVRLELRGAYAGAVQRWVEGVLGWQVVDGTTPGEVPAALMLRDHGHGDGPAGRAAADHGRVEPSGRLPTVLLVGEGADALEAATAALETGAVAAIAWPQGRDRLADVALGVLDSAAVPVTRSRLLTIGGAAGGAGTTTVALAVAGLHAWAGTPTLALVRGSGLGLRTVEAGAVSDPALWSRAATLPGVPRLRAVQVEGWAPEIVPRDPRPGVVIQDQGVGDDVDVLVCRPDAAALAALDRTTAGVVVVVGQGAVDLSRLGAAAEGRTRIWLPWSARVARAGLGQRVPSGLPGAWLRRLGPIVDDRGAQQREVTGAGPVTRG